MTLKKLKFPCNKIMLIVRSCEGRHLAWYLVGQINTNYLRFSHFSQMRRGYFAKV